MRALPNETAAPNVHSTEEGELVRRAAEGETEAFGELVRKHQPAVLGFLLSVFRDRSLAEDAAQSAFVKAFESIEGFEGRSSFKTWVTKIAWNEARSMLRRAKVLCWLPLSAPLDGDGRTFEDTIRDAAGQQGLERVERKLALERAMDKLTLREREVAALRLEGYKLSEIGEVLGISEGTVKWTLFEATGKMKEGLA
jgi:RNA polymerase sigma-70 factor, ECF subfamily